MSTLQAAWVSKASEKQRRGRAGRCQPGVAFHCYSRTRSQALAELQLPELKRSPLDELCLQVCLPHSYVLMHLSLLVFFMINATPKATHLQSEKRVETTLQDSDKRQTFHHAFTLLPTHPFDAKPLGLCPIQESCLLPCSSVAPTNQPDAAPLIP